MTCILCRPNFESGFNSCYNCGNKFVHKLSNGLLIPVETPKKPDLVKPKVRKPYNNYVFECYRYCDILKFLEILDNKGGILISVAGKHRPFDGSYFITYQYEEEIICEVKC
jgi:hypothetical protein